MLLIVKNAVKVSILSALILAGTRVNAQDQGTSSPGQAPATNGSEASPPSEGSNQGPTALTGDQQSAATKALCSALSGHYKDAASAGLRRAHFQARSQGGTGRAWIGWPARKRSRSITLRPIWVAWGSSSASG